MDTPEAKTDTPDPERVTLSDICIVAGACAVAAGISFIYWQAGVITAGLLLIALGFWVFD